MAKPNLITLGDGQTIPILYEDRAVLAIDKPRGWMLVPFNWQKTSFNLLAAISSSISSGEFWARSRNLNFLRHVHRLDADTSGILLFAKSLGAVESFGALFEERKMEKRYLAVVHGVPAQREWVCQIKLTAGAEEIGRVRADPVHGKESETVFRVLDSRKSRSLIEARPITGRTHQIRVHLAESGCPVVGDPLYGPSPSPVENLALRAIRLAYMDPFRRKRVVIEAPTAEFLKEFRFT